MYTRRSFIQTLSLGAAGTLILPQMLTRVFAGQKPFFKISLAEWSLHRTLRAGKLDHMDFPKVARQTYGIDAVEYVNQFFKDKARDKTYLKELKQRTEDLGVHNVLIMIDGEGDLADTAGETRREQAVEQHYKWVEAAAFLGCHAIRVNLRGKGSREAMGHAAVSSLRKLSDFARDYQIEILVENHGGLSSDGKWLSGVLKEVDSAYCGSLPDLGNFYEYDRYQGVTELMPFAAGVSAKTHDFDAQGNETQVDYARMLNIIKAAGYKGYIGIEYEGDSLSEDAGIIATRNLLQRLGQII